MDHYSLTDKAICAETGRRIKALRLRKNLTQQQLSEATALSLNSIKALESGKGKLLTIITVLRELGALDALENFIPEVTISPLQIARQQGKKRQRASGKRGKKSPGEKASW
ncbi:MAG: helix-turn-helix transcriptional regulator [Desulfobacterales bacterium]|nr:helix-turn-helix transcriptional regulator [Desulfobacterales bacterium]